MGPVQVQHKTPILEGFRQPPKNPQLVSNLGPSTVAVSLLPRGFRRVAPRVFVRGSGSKIGGAILGHQEKQRRYSNKRQYPDAASCESKHVTT